MYRLLFVLSLSISSLAHAALTLHVSPDGQAGNSGASAGSTATDGPLPSLEAARDKIRTLRNAGELAGPVEVIVHGGNYPTPGPLLFGPEDGGTLAAPVTYRAGDDASPLLSGGLKIDGWRQEGDLWVADIPTIEGKPWVFEALWVNGERRTIARTPNVGEYFRTAGKADPVTDLATGEAKPEPNRAFKYTQGDIRPFGNLEDAVVVVYHAWETGEFRIERLDEASNTVLFKSAGVWPFEQWGEKQRYHVENIREGLDLSGEWYLDRKAAKLYYMPMPGEDLDSAEIIAPRTEKLLIIAGEPTEGRYVEHLHFRGLRLAHTDFPIGPKGHHDPQAAVSVSAAMEWRGARYCSFTDGAVGHTGGYGIALLEGCADARIVRNEVVDTGAGGIRVGAYQAPSGDTKDNPLFPTRIFIDNNLVHKGGRIFRGACGVYLVNANYITVSHNEITDYFYTGISNGWVWGYGENPTHHNTIAFNHIHHIGQGVLSDMGGIYNLGIQPGTILDNNLIHDVYSYQYGGWGLYTDEGSSEIQLINNVVYNTTTGGFHQHYGQNNRVRNNIFAFAKEEHIIVTRVEEHRSVIFEHNIVLTANGRALSPNWLKADVWLDYNVYWDLNNTPLDFSGLDFEAWRAQKGQDIHSVVADPRFVDAAGFDFTLHPDSPAIALGFEPIDISRVGRYGAASALGK